MVSTMVHYYYIRQKNSSSIVYKPMKFKYNDSFFMQVYDKIIFNFIINFHTSFAFCNDPKCHF